MCQGKCGDCHAHGLHAPCRVQCERDFMCGHKCGQSCHLPDRCGECTRSCLVKCEHSSCPLKCSDVCASCAQPCTWACSHQGACEMPCGAPCSRLPCNMRCEKILACGHRCPSLCGERCPSQAFCIQCGSKGGEIVDLIEMKTLAEWDADAEPLIVLQCGHVYAPSTLDEHVGLGRYYRTSHADEYDPDEEQVQQEGMRVFVALEPYMYLADGAVKAPASCPSCKAVITGVNRYGRPQNYAMLRVLEQKQLIKTDLKLAQIMSVESPDLDEQRTQLTKIVTDLQRHSPTKMVFEAAAGSD
eukprot:1313078-Prymnesium_polylepis.1